MAKVSYTKDAPYTPKKGDLVWFYTVQDHAAIVMVATGPSIQLVMLESGDIFTSSREGMLEQMRPIKGQLVLENG